jgi:hypothetical protein
MSRAAYALGVVALAACLTFNVVFAQLPSSATPRPTATDKAMQNSAPDDKTKMEMMADCTKEAKKQKL